MFDYSSLFSHVVVELLEKAEECFKMINYRNHNEDLFQLSMVDTTNFGSGKDYSIAILQTWKTHIHIGLSVQGIHLAEKENIRLDHLVNILEQVCILGTASLKDIYATGIKPSEADDPLHFVVDLLKQLTDIPEEKLLTYIESINEEIVLFLQNHEPNQNVLLAISSYSEHRFKNSPLLKKGIVVETIRKLNSFGYDLDLFIKTHSYEISQLRDVEDIAREIILMVLGSSIDISNIALKCYEISEHILDTKPTELLKVNSLINKYFNERGENA